MNVQQKKGTPKSIQIPKSTANLRAEKQVSPHHSDHGLNKSIAIGVIDEHHPNPVVEYQRYQQY